MTESELINLFINWMKLDENLKPSYNSYIKENILKQWNQNYFNNKLFNIDLEKISESINNIENIVLNNKNQDWKDFSKRNHNQAPEAILGKKNYLKFLKIIEKKYSSESTEDINNNAQINRNYFVLWTNESSIQLLTKNTNESFWHTGNYNLFKITKKDDIVFFVQKGEASKVSWEIGLSGICKIVEIRKDLKGKKRGSLDYYDVLLEPLFILPAILDKSKFKDYVNTKEILHIARTDKNDPNQTNWEIPLELTKNLVGALLDIFPKNKSEIENIFGYDFANPPINIPSNNTNNNLQNQLKNINFNVIENEPRNLIVYGAPGTGKSYQLKTKTEGDGKGIKGLFPDEWLRTRITFHPNYSYRNFVGSYKPKPLYKESDKQIFGSDTITKNAQHQKEPFIEYQFEPGPFLEMLIRAVNYPKYNFVLIIEEINRANTAGVFGDVFQLLDRNESGDSEYSITLEPSAHDYLKANGIMTSSIIIPKNLYLWATMNSADQGVMPLDSAFKRRWNFEHIGLNENMSNVDTLYIEIPFYTDSKFRVKWNEFRKVVNDKLLSEGIHEDKLIGPFFLNKFEISDVKSVKNKLLLYLKEDVLRYKSCLFHASLRSFSEISERFTNCENIFSDDIIFTKEPINNNDVENEGMLEQTNSQEIEIEKEETQNKDAQ